MYVSDRDIEHFQNNGTPDGWDPEVWALVKDTVKADECPDPSKPCWCRSCRWYAAREN